MADLPRRAVTRTDRPAVEVGDLVTTESYPVLTRGHGDSVVVRPRQIG